VTEQPHIHVGVTKKLPDGKGGYTEITINVSRVSPSTNFEPAILTARDLAHEIMAEVEAKFDGEIRSVPVGYLGRRAEPFTVAPKIDPGAFGVSAAVPSVDVDEQQASDVAEAIAKALDKADEPTATTETPAPDPEEERVTGLMAALQASLDAAKAKSAKKQPELVVGLHVKRTDRPSEQFVIAAITPKGIVCKNLDDPFEDPQTVAPSVIIGGIVVGDKSGRSEEPSTEAATPAEPVASEPPANIPDDRDVATHYEAFGVLLTVPAKDDWGQPYTKTGGDSGGGQCKAVNTALSESGFGGKLRHIAAGTLLSAMGIERGDIDTLDQLSKAEASLILEWFDKATADALAGLSLAMNGLAVAA